MEEKDSSRSRMRLVVLPAALLVVGVLAGAGVIAGVNGFGSSGTSSAGATTASSAAGSGLVARTSAQLDAATIYERDSPGVVDITVTQDAQDGSGSLSPFVPGGSQQSGAEGTGFVLTRNGDIVTADHVVSGAGTIRVKFKDGTTAKATLVGADPSTDTAVIRVSVPATRLAPLTLADSTKIVPGQGVVAIGSPFGLVGSITAGIVSAVGRDIQAPNGYTIPNAIQTDAPINHGNSGGPLIDSSGQVVGINVQIADDGAGGTDNAGVGFAVPSSTVKNVVSEILAGRTVQHAYLGVTVGDAAAIAGAKIGTVRAGSPGASAGLKSGDVITAVDGIAVTGAGQLTSIVGDHKPGDELELTVERNGAKVTLHVTLGNRPATSTT